MFFMESRGVVALPADVGKYRRQHADAARGTICVSIHIGYIDHRTQATYKRLSELERPRTTSSSP